MGLNWGGGVVNTTTFQNKPNFGTSYISLQYYLVFLNTTSLQNACAFDLKSKWEK